MLERLEKRYSVFRIAEFAIASAIGFFVTEVILILSVLAFYHSTQVPRNTNSSLAILGIDALSFGIGVTVAFIINEHVTIKGGPQKGSTSWIVRWGKYQLASLLGNIIIIIVQLGLLATISLSPVYGNIVGAIVSYPVTYVISMQFVWGVRTLGNK